MFGKLRNIKEINLFESRSPFMYLFVSLIIGIFIIYTNISVFNLERKYLGETKHTIHLLFFIFRYLYFSGVIWVLLSYNIRMIKAATLKKRLIHSLIISTIAFFLYLLLSIKLNPKKEWFEGLVIFQFLVMTMICSLIGHVNHLYTEQRKTEKEIEQLRIENLQSRYDALTNQINPHFFFNSLNGLTSLIRKKNDENSLAYVNMMSDVFRYILQSDKKVLVSLGEELEFVQSFRYMMEVRFANKLIFSIDVDLDKRHFKIPVLALLPLIENVVVHNIIDSDHKMEVTISMNDEMELVVTNPVYPKLIPADTNGTGLKNLESRFSLLMNKQIRVEDDGNRYTVYLPLKPE
jgi:sensor histidine kinase YesM